MFEAIRGHIASSHENGHHEVLYDLQDRIRELDVQLRQIRRPSDFKVVFGEEKGFELMAYHIATNGTLRKKLARLVVDGDRYRPRTNDEFL